MKIWVLAAAVSSMALSGCTSFSDRNLVTHGTATIHDPEGRAMGTLQLQSGLNKLRLSGKLHGLPAGPHAVHLHTTGICSPPEFKSAGGHLNPFEQTHGTKGGGFGHLGDLPNAKIAVDGTVNYYAVIQSSPDNALPLIFDADGTSIVIHAGPDDYKTDPSGAAGIRIACGDIQAS